MKLVLFLSFLNLSLAFNITGNDTSSTVKHQLKIQHPKSRIFISIENLPGKSIASNASIVPGTASIDAARNYRHVDVSRPSKLKKPQRKLHIPCVSSKCVAEKIQILLPLRSKIQAGLRPTGYIELRGQNELAGPEGKIAEALARSINASLAINGIQPFELILNLTPITTRGAWSLVYHPYRKVPLVPVIQRGIGSIEARVTFCLLTMLTIMIIVLLHIMRNLIRINDSKSSDSLEFLRCIVVPRSLAGGVEKFFYLCLAFGFFVNLGIILEIVFREKYGKINFEKIQSIDDLDELHLTPVFSTEQCLRELLIDKSNKIYCVVDEDFGKEVVRRYGNDGRDRSIQLIDAVQLGFEWRGMHLDDDRHLERFDRAQMELSQSGLLDKWYKDEMIVNLGKDEMEMKRVRAGWSARRRDENERLKKFVYFLVTIVSNGALLACFMFMAECAMFCGAKERDIYYLWN